MKRTSFSEKQIIGVLKEAEAGAKTADLARSHGRCAKGERLRMGFPHGHCKTTTLVAGLRMTGRVAPMVLDRPINGDWFEAYVAQVLIPDCDPATW
jgi:hypothetical protein